MFEQKEKYIKAATRKPLSTQASLEDEALPSTLNANKLQNLSSALQSSIEVKKPEKSRDRWAIGG